MTEDEKIQELFAISAYKNRHRDYDFKKTYMHTTPCVKCNTEVTIIHWGKPPVEVKCNPCMKDKDAQT